MIDERLTALSEKLLSLIEKHGPRSSEVRDFIKSNRDQDGFESLALTIILLKEELPKLR